MTENLKLDLGNIPEEILEMGSPQPGDVYTKAGHKAGFWVVIAVNGNSCYCLAFDIEGNVTGCQNYGPSYFRERDHRFVGRTEVPELKVQWDYSRRMRQ